MHVIYNIIDLLYQLVYAVVKSFDKSLHSLVMRDIYKNLSLREKRIVYSVCRSKLLVFIIYLVVLIGLFEDAIAEFPSVIYKQNKVVIRSDGKYFNSPIVRKGQLSDNRQERMFDTKSLVFAGLPFNDSQWRIQQTALRRAVMLLLKTSARIPIVFYISAYETILLSYKNLTKNRV